MTKQDDAIARKGRMLALVVAGAMALWIGGQALRSALEMPLRYAFLIDFMAIAAFVWALVVATQVWRARQQSRDQEG